jgi:hypothetical protein
MVIESQASPVGDTAAGDTTPTSPAAGTASVEVQYFSGAVQAPAHPVGQDYAPAPNPWSSAVPEIADHDDSYESKRRRSREQAEQMLRN